MWPFFVEIIFADHTETSLSRSSEKTDNKELTSDWRLIFGPHKDNKETKEYRISKCIRLLLL